MRWVLCHLVGRVIRVALFRRAARDEAHVLVVIDLRDLDVPHRGVTEITQHRYQEVRFGDVVGVERCENVIVRGADLGQPGVVVPVLGVPGKLSGIGLEFRLVPSAVVPRAQSPAERGDLGRIALVQHPGVVRVLHPDHRLDRLRQHAKRLGARHEGGRHGHSKTGGSLHRFRPAHPPEEKPPGKPGGEVKSDEQRGDDEGPLPRAEMGSRPQPDPVGAEGQHRQGGDRGQHQEPPAFPGGHHRHHLHRCRGAPARSIRRSFAHRFCERARRGRLFELLWHQSPTEQGVKAGRKANSLLALSLRDAPRPGVGPSAIGVPLQSCRSA
jgi:hypothetical protein